MNLTKLGMCNKLSDSVSKYVNKKHVILIFARFK